jgi:deoxycytidylate deaminase
MIKILLKLLKLFSNGKWKVSCVVVKAGGIISTGYNKRLGNGKVIHAEMMALSKLSADEVRGSIVYCTWSPCIDCERVMRNMSVSQVRYIEEYSLNKPAKDLCKKI